MAKLVGFIVVLVCLGIYFFWTEVLLQDKILKKKKTYKVVSTDSSGNKIVKYQQASYFKDLSELVKDVTSLERKFLLVMFFLVGIFVAIILFGAFCHYDIAKGKFVETEKSWRGQFFQ